jgi:hypothetical protein
LGHTEPGHYWPPEAPEDDHVDSYRRVFELQGYEVCDSPDVEPGYEKVAVYWGRSGPHAAKQLPDGKWKSKLGDREDIEHNTLDALETDGVVSAYGKVRYILKRPIR